jgi:hypothetical protein
VLPQALFELFSSLSQWRLLNKLDEPTLFETVLLGEMLQPLRRVAIWDVRLQLELQPHGPGVMRQLSIIEEVAANDKWSLFTNTRPLVFILLALHLSVVLLDDMLELLHHLRFVWLNNLQLSLLQQKRLKTVQFAVQRDVMISQLLLDCQASSDILQLFPIVSLILFLENQHVTFVLLLLAGVVQDEVLFSLAEVCPLISHPMAILHSK